MCLIYVGIFSLVSDWKYRFETLNNRLNVYRRSFVVQRKEIICLKRTIRRLRTKMRKYVRVIRAHEDFIFGPILKGSLE